MEATIKVGIYYNRYFDRLIEIDCNNSGKYCMDPDDLFQITKDRHGICIVATNETDFPVGFCVYTLKNTEYIDILHIATDEQRQGIGTLLINKVKGKLNKKRTYLNFDVPETNLNLSLFLKKQGFTAKLVRKTFGDIYRFKWN